MQLSIVDVGQVPEGGTVADALGHTVALARAAERLGFARYWIAEHHGRGETFASSNPEVIVARVAAATSTIRVGSGGVLLNHYSPFKVAETFRVLHALYPGRIDLGFGKADGVPVVDFALRKDRDVEPVSDDPMAGMMAWLAQEEQVRELVDWLDGSFPPGHPFADVTLLPGVVGGPEPWLLGASSTTATLAGRLGLGFCFAGFLNPDGAVAAFQAYRHVCAREPRTMLAVNVACGATDEEGDRLRSSVELFWRRARERPDEVRREPLADPDAAVAELGGVPEPSRLADGTWPHRLSGSPGRVRETLEEMVAATGADELMLQDMIARPADRLRSYELIADVFDLSPAPVATPAPAGGGGWSP